MPGNFIDQNGLTIQTRPQILSELINGADGFLGYLGIYGADINLDPNSADGQTLNLFAQGKIDVLELAASIYASFDPEQSIGVALDRIVGINGVARKAGTYTLTNVSVTTTQAVTLDGLDTAPNNPFIVSDAAGNQFLLITHAVFGAAGTQSLAFRAAKLGAIVPTINTIVNPVTIILGVSTINNPTAPTSIGTNEETDYALRVRRARSVAIPSQGVEEGLVGALLAIDGVTSVFVEENPTDTTDANGVPSHSVWIVVAGGTDAAVADVIYRKRNMGCGMYNSGTSSVSVAVARPNGQTINILFDRPITDDLWISFNLTALSGSIDPVYVRNQILEQLSYEINQPADASAIVAMVKALTPNAYVSSEGVSATDGSYAPILNTLGVQHQWVITAARIKINGVTG